MVSGVSAAKWLAAGAIAFASLGHSLPSARASRQAIGYDVRAFGAKGDGVALDSPAINRAIDAAAAAGGGTVWFPAGTYRSVSIHLKSHVALQLERGATIMAADHTPDAVYDRAEEFSGHAYQDYGHTHFHNSLIWGEDLEDVSILGPGRIWGKGLVSDETKNPDDGNKSIALKNCRYVLIRDVTIQHGGWFGILATGVDHLTIDNLIFDTNRDGMDVDCCRDVHISNCSVNSPHDDGICLKSSFALGTARATENVTITNCLVCGFPEGSFLDGTFKRGQRGGTGRIKFGTESNGGFRNIAISNCVFDYCDGLAFETVDGGLLEDVTISNLTMRDIGNCPIFIRLGRRMRGPDGVPVGACRRISISKVRVDGARSTSIISGLPGYPIEDLSLDNVQIVQDGSTDKKNAGVTPPEDETGYPEPSRFGRMPSYGFFVRHVKNLEMTGVDLRTRTPDIRPPFQLADVDGADFFRVKAQLPAGAPMFSQDKVKRFRARFVDAVK